MSPVVERLAELRRHLDHLRGLRPRVTGAEELHRDLSLENDVLHSLQIVCQVVIDIAAELSARRALRFEDYTGAVRNLSLLPGFPPELTTELERLPGFRNVLVHGYTGVDLDRVIAALDRLDLIEEFAGAVRRLEAEDTR